MPRATAKKFSLGDASTRTQNVSYPIFYILCTGCAWQILPDDFPKWQTVYY
ncbi:transposase [Nostoc sp. UHCC 0251]|uniref:transposase n=1 Tax=Nostoc sp. UHCC 0251 TaxID=3110240 RepID=UPI002B1F4F3D|nr:transposase [Nostoc sp. UHCC 0251]MEA5625722.1 transposase [Nostoc sp. UHCC 0251]